MRSCAPSCCAARVETEAAGSQRLPGGSTEGGGVFMLPAVGEEQTEAVPSTTEKISNELKKVLQEHRRHLEKSLLGFQSEHQGLLQRQEQLVSQLLEQSDRRRVSARPSSRPQTPQTPSPGRSSAAASPHSRLLQEVSPREGSTEAEAVMVVDEEIVEDLGEEGYEQPDADSEPKQPSDQLAADGSEQRSDHRGRGRRGNQDQRQPQGRRGRQSRRRKATLGQRNPFEPVERAILGLGEKPQIQTLVGERVDRWPIPDKWKKRISRTDGPLSGIVKRPFFTAGTNLLIMSNVIFIAVEAQHLIHQAWVGAEPSETFDAIDSFFSVAFTLELGMHLIGERVAFFIGPAWRWNVMDLVFVTTDLMNQLFVAIASNSGEGGADFLASIRGASRSLRLARAARALRAFRALSFLPQVKVLVQELMRSVMAMFWMLLLLSVIFLFFSLMFMQATTEGLTNDEVGELTSGKLLSHFDSLQGAALSLFQVVTGGVEWQSLHAALTEVSSFYGIAFLVYIFFVVLAFLNIVGATFVESAFATKQRQDVEEANRASKEVGRIVQEFGCQQEGGMLNLEDLLDLLEVREMREYLESINLDGTIIRAIFDLLDWKGHKSVRVEDLAQGCAKFARAVRGSDFVAVLLANRLLSTQLQKVGSAVDVCVACLEES